MKKENSVKDEEKIINGMTYPEGTYNDSTNATLAENTNSVVSEGGPGARDISKVVKKSQDVVGYELSDGQRVTVEEAVAMAKQNQLNHVGVSVSKMGEEYIRSLPDGDESNNLSNLPVVTD